ncbi:MAG: SpoIIE family protein phosphatase, partial [Verrucomicrobiia bacterium]
TRTTLDRSDLVLSVFMPLVDDRGRTFGATGLDVRPGRVIKGSLLPKSWQGHLRVLLVRGEEDPPGLVVLAEQREGEEGQAWQVHGESARLTVADPRDLQAMVDGIRAGRSGVVEMDFEERPTIWAFAPSAIEQDVLVLMIPEAAVVDEARGVQDYVWGRVYVFVSATLVVFFVLAGLVVLVSFVCSAAFTRPLYAIMETVVSLADGDFKARAEVRTRDERQTLAEAVNALAPALEEHVELKQSLQLADAVQHHLLPAAPIQMGDVVVAGSAVYSAETGGDYFDYTLVEGPLGQAVAVAIGDVSGHGIGSALLMATGRALLRGEARQARDLGEAVGVVNDQLVSDASGGQFLTLFCLSLVPNTGHLRWTSAGHDPALVFNPVTGQFRELAGGGLALGIMPGRRYETFSGVLALGEWIILATDGVWEARRKDGEMFGKDRLREVIRAQGESTVREMIEAILAAVAEFRGSETQQDDITVVAVRRRTEEVG